MEIYTYLNWLNSYADINEKAISDAITELMKTAFEE
jgi:hypothetical protein